MSHRAINLGSIAKIKSGGTPARNNNAYWNGNIPWVKTSQVQNCTITAEDIDEWITEEGSEQSSAKIIPKGTILMAMYGQGRTRGQVAILGIDAAINQACAAIQLGQGVVRDYVYQQLLFRYESIRALSNTGGQENLNADLIREIAFPLPNIHEQEAVAQLLIEWDTAIEKTERLITAKERRLAGIRQKIFGGRLRGLKSNWMSVHLSEVLDEHVHLSTGKEEVFSVSVHKGLINQVEHLGRSFSACDTSNYNLVHRGDIVYTKSPTGNFPYGIVKQSLAEDDVIVSPLYGVFSPLTPELGLLIDFYFESPTNAENYLRPLTQKGAKNTINITNSTFLSGKLELPLDPIEQKRIAEFVLEARKEVSFLKAMRLVYERQKRGLMQKLLTGQWRVKVKEQKVA